MQIGVDEATVHNWEVKGTEPGLRHLPGIIQLLGYNPLPPASSLAEQIIRYRKTHGLSREVLARRLGVDPGTLWRWEASIGEPKGKYLKTVVRLLHDAGDGEEIGALQPDETFRNLRSQPCC